MISKKKIREWKSKKRRLWEKNHRWRRKLIITLGN